MVSGRFKIVVLGEQSVGKTSLVTRFIHDHFDDAYQATIGIDFLAKTLYLKNSTVRLQIWDTAGQERFHSLIPAYIRDCSAAIIVYDVSKTESFEWVDNWMDAVRKQQSGNPDVVLALAANKIDLKDTREVSSDEGASKARDFGALFFETSAKTDKNVRPLFERLAERLLEVNADDPHVEDSEISVYQPSTVDLSNGEPIIALDGLATINRTSCKMC